MISLLLAHLMNQTFTIEPTADAWVYPHASDGGRDTFLRIWGAGGKSVAQDAGEIENFSYGYLKFELPRTAPTKGIKSAVLVLTHIADPAYTAEFSKLNPIEVHSLGTAFEDKTWSYDIAQKVVPSAKEIFGKAWAEKLTKDGKEFQITIDLMKGPASFEKYWAGTITGERMMGLALASVVDVAEVGTKSAYKVYSHESENPDKRPKLIVEFEN